MNNLDTLEITIASLGYGGQGVAKPKGAVLFVPRGLPGDKLRVRIKHMKKRFGVAELLEIIEPSPSRINPRCSGFDKGCGGCHWLHMRYEDQLFHKEKILRETLKHIGKISIKINPIIAAKHQKGCRNKFSLRVDHDGTIGLCKEKSRLVLGLDTCKLELEANEACYRAIKSLSSRGGRAIGATRIHIRSSSDKKTGICLFAPTHTKYHKIIWNELKSELPLLTGMGVKSRHSYALVAGEANLFENINGLAFGIPHQSFFQTNFGQAAELMKIVSRFADLSAKDSVLDLYCGVGFFTLSLAQSCDAVRGVELDSHSIQACRENAKLNNIKNVRFTAGDVARVLGEKESKRIDIAVLDPPRRGCERAVLESLILLKPKRIVYVSCAPDTLARDLAFLAQAGYYSTECQPIDMFPQTFHIETVVKLER